MKRDYSSEIRMMKEKYSPLIINKTFWEGKSVAEFFSEYREIVTKIIIDYPGESLEKYFNPAYRALEKALQNNGINAPIVIRECPSECNCQEKYSNYKEGYVYHRFKTE